MKVFIPVGISGAGKSTYQKKNLPDVRVVCADDIRKEFTGNISDMSMNDEVWVEAYNRLKDFAFLGKDIYFSSTNLSIKSIKKIIKEVLESKKRGLKLSFEILLFTDSYDEDLCRSRVDRDIKNGVDRSNTLKKITDEKGEELGFDVIHDQHRKFIDVVPKIKDLIEENLVDLHSEYEIHLKEV